MPSVDWVSGSEKSEEFFSKVGKGLKEAHELYDYTIGIERDEIARLKKLQAYCDSVSADLISGAPSLERILAGCVKFFYDTFILESSDTEEIRVSLEKYLMGVSVTSEHGLKPVYTDEEVEDA